MIELLHEKTELALTAHKPLELVSVKPDPVEVVRKVAHVWVLHVPYERKQPIVSPEEVNAVMVDLGGAAVPVPDGCVEVVVVVTVLIPIVVVDVVADVDVEVGSAVIVVVVVVVGGIVVAVVDVGFKLTLVAGLAPNLGG